MNRCFKALTILIFILLLWGYYVHYPFCKLSQMVETTDKKGDTCMYGKLIVYKEYLPLYMEASCIKKGDIYSDVEFKHIEACDSSLEIKDSRKYKSERINLKFGSDNSILIKSKSLDYQLQVDSIYVSSDTYLCLTQDPYEIYHVSKDSLFLSICFFDSLNNCVEFVKQKSSHKYNGKDKGFSIHINGQYYRTGNRHYFDY